jgi:hypothetical protein
MVDTIRLLERGDEIVVIIITIPIWINEIVNSEGKLWPATEVLLEWRFI